ncbi:MAG: FAD-binding oxidoreductase [Chloroflexi bacterium]|nr:FAD-binding oxidoreductase [Chloroflexota bacterium]
MMNDEMVDVVVVGGGVIGTAVTYYLAKNNVNVCLLERGDITNGTSSAAANGVALQTKPPGPKQDLARASAELFHGLSEELDTDIEFSNEGGMLVAETEEQLAMVSEKAKKGAKSGLQIDILSAKETLARQPALASHVTGAAYCAEDSTVSPYLLAFAYVRAAKRLGATIRTGVEVTGIERQGERITAVITNQGKILTDTVVNATGPWTSKLAQMVNVHLPVEPRKGELFVTEPGPSIVRGIVISASYLLSKSLSTEDALSGKMTAGLFASQSRRGNLVIGSTREFSGYARQSSYRGMHKLVQQVATLIPVVAKLHVLRFYAGLRPSTPDGLPILGRAPELPGFVIAAGHEGDGIALSPITGKSIAELITNQISEETLAPFSPKRFH